MTPDGAAGYAKMRAVAGGVPGVVRLGGVPGGDYTGYYPAVRFEAYLWNMEE